MVQALLHTLLDVFDATRDLYNTLRNKERRDREKGYVDARRSSYSDDEIASDEGIVLDKAAVTRQFDIGLEDIGALFAVGDGKYQRAVVASHKLTSSHSNIPDSPAGANHCAAVCSNHDLPIRTHVV